MSPPTTTTLETIDDLLKITTHHLYALQSSIHGYLPETHAALTARIKLLTACLTQLALTAPALPVLIPPEIVEYVEQGRNPDIYTREFVELVQRGNAYVRGKSEGMRGFRDALAAEMVGAWPELGGVVGGIVGRGA